MMPWWGFAVFAFGANFILWGFTGLARLVDERSVLSRLGALLRWRRPDRSLAPVPEGRFTVDDVAVLIPAHNEEVVITDSLAAIIRLVPKENVHVVSDGSTDDTVALATRTGVHVTATKTNLGKAGALEAAIAEFRLVERFPVVMLLDADTRVQPGYFTAALPLFDDPELVAVAGCVRTARDRRLSAVGGILIWHRTRIYALGQRILKFGQTWAKVNATHIVPGFASLYRTATLPKIDMNPPGLVIEDFNMTFEVYRHRLGKVGFSLDAVAETQDPDTLRDYVRQTRRWSLGLWQTVRRHPPSASLFTVMITVLLIELITSSLIFLLLPLLFLVLLLPDALPATLGLPVFGEVHLVVAAHVNVTTLVFGILVPDLLMTVLVALLEGRPKLLLGAPFFVFLRVLDAATALVTLPLAWVTRSDGRWRSPARRALTTPTAADEPEPVAAALPDVEVAG
ncbi:MAG TPA: glycosyltransferase [Pseudonocardiaceae bacterium]|jgi:cellulose synthase/poly-beta-1,6-N-acetylglucosamine synthase-like glycosyltransferase|nr:glycosyltransferase [Pseudonocardiaceae bacterium]